MKFIVSTLAIFILSSTTAFTQKFELERIEFEYRRLPLQPLPKEVKTYKVVCENTHAASVASMQENYDAEKDEAQEEVDSEHQAVKIINSIQGNSSKARFIEKPYMPKIYDGPLVTNKIILENLEKADDGEITVTLEMQGLSHSKTLMTGGSSESRTYYYKVSAKHEMKIRVTDAAGSVLSEFPVSGSDSSRYASTKKFSSTEALNDYWAKSKYDILLPLDDKISEANFKKANIEVNSQHGISVQKRPFKLAVISDKKMDYSNYATAYEATFEGAIYYLDDEAKAVAKFNEAIDLWEKELEESDLKNKKARINKKVTAATRYNCIVMHVWARQYDKANLHYVKLKMLDLGKYNRQMKMLKAFIDDQEARYKANQ